MTVCRTLTVAGLVLAALARAGAAQGVARAADTLRALDAAAGKSCLTTTAGAGYCWGAVGASLGRPYRVFGPDGRPARLRTMSAGSPCALTGDGDAWCDMWVTGGWIDSAGREVAAPAACDSTECVVPLPMRGALPAPPLREVVAGGHHACALALNGAAFCWGRNHMGQLGSGVWTPDSTGSGGEFVRAPTAVAGGLRFAQLTAGEAFTCGLTQIGGRVYCWGYAQQGQVGDSATATYCTGPHPQGTSTCSRAIPTLVVPESLPGERATRDVRFVRVRAGMGLACAASDDGAAYCWGSNYRCALGWCRRPDSHRAHRIQVPGRVVDVGAGYWHACARTADRRLFCWGDNGEGQLGSLVSINAGPDGAPPDYRDSTDSEARETAYYRDPCFLGGRCSPAPVEVAPGRRWAELAVGPYHACALDAADGGVYCWGGTDSAALGRGARMVSCENRSASWPDVRCQPTPTRVTGLPPLAAPAPQAAMMATSTSRRASALAADTRVLVSAREVRIVFPPDTARAWGWSGLADPSYNAAYVWHVLVDGLDGPEIISLQAARPPGGSARDFPSLDSLVAAGSAMMCGVGMVQQCATSPRVTARVEQGRVVITLRDSATVRRLFGMRPDFVKPWHARPDAESRYTSDSVRVTYVEPQLPRPDDAMRAEAAARRRRYEERVRWNTRQIVATPHGQAGGITNELWLAVGDSVSLDVLESHCQYDVCGGSIGGAVSDSGWSVADSTIVRVYTPRVDPRRPSILGPLAAAVAEALRPGRTELRVRGLLGPADSMPSRTAVPRELRRTVVVAPPAERVEFSSRPAAARLGDTLDLRVRVTDRAGRPIEGAPVELRLFDERGRPVMTVAAPLRFAPDRSGLLRVIATFGGRADTLAIQVRRPLAPAR